MRSSFNTSKVRIRTAVRQLSSPGIDNRHVLRRDVDSILRVALDLKMSGKRKRGRPKKQVEEETEKTGLKMEDALNQERWSAKNWERNGVNPVISAEETIPDKN